MAQIRIGAPPALAISVSGADGQGVGRDDLEPAGPTGADLGERRQRALVAFDGDDGLGACGDERPGEAARTGTDLDDGDAVERPGGARDPGREIEIEQEILAERLAGVEAAARHDLAQRRQPVGRQRHRVSRSASLSAAIRLAGLATPRPAMSNAVP